MIDSDKVEKMLGRCFICTRKAVAEVGLKLEKPIPAKDGSAEITTVRVYVCEKHRLAGITA